MNEIRDILTRHPAWTIAAERKRGGGPATWILRMRAIEPNGLDYGIEEAIGAKSVELMDHDVIGNRLLIMESKIENRILSEPEESRE